MEEVFGGNAQIVLRKIVEPVRQYYVRCNTLKISPSGLLTRLCEKGFETYQNPVIPEGISFRVEGPYEIPVASKTVVVDKETAESVLQGANVYAPGIKDCGSIGAGDKVTVLSEFGDLIGSGNVFMSANDILTFRKGLAVSVNHRRFVGPKVSELSELSVGLLYPQSLAAMATVRVLAPKEDETIVDMNCAPGGKLSHISQLMGNTGKVFGFDRNRRKLAEAHQNLSRLGCKNVVLSIHDSRYLPDDFPHLKVDRVLVDPPCSALGLRPKIYDYTTRKRVNDLANYQRQFIKAASKIVKPGGVVVYSVCTFTTQECEEIVNFAESECGLRTVEQEPFVGSKGLAAPGDSGSKCQRFHPDKDEIGYFIARFES